MSFRTPQVHGDTIMQEARNLAALTSTGSALSGGATPAFDSAYGFEGATPKRVSAETPNLQLQTPRLDEAAAGASQDSSAAWTPLRDSLRINTADASVRSGTDSVSSTPRHDPAVLVMQRRSLRAAFASLPKPKNDFDVVVPDMEEIANQEKAAAEKRARDSMQRGTAALVKDASEVEEEQAAAQEAAEAARLARRSMVLQRGLPRPVSVSRPELRSLSGLKPLQQADELIKREMLAMLLHDAAESPTAGGQPASNVTTSEFPFEPVSDDDMDSARALLETEMARLAVTPLSAEEFDTHWHAALSDIVYVPSQQRYARAVLVNKREKLESVQAEVDAGRESMRREARKAAKMEKRLDVLLGGYQRRSESLAQEIEDLARRIQQSEIDYTSYEKLREQELRGIEGRLASAEGRVVDQQRRERDLQAQYQQLIYQRDDLLRQRHLLAL
jgi:pre-mRNA-splicing factor CDC5/CEF1